MRTSEGVTGDSVRFRVLGPPCLGQKVRVLKYGQIFRINQLLRPGEQRSKRNRPRGVDEYGSQLASFLPTRRTFRQTHMSMLRDFERRMLQRWPQSTNKSTDRFPSIGVKVSLY
jgi:hypothetical protein